MAAEVQSPVSQNEMAYSCTLSCLEKAKSHVVLKAQIIELFVAFILILCYLN